MKWQIRFLAWTLLIVLTLLLLSFPVHLVSQYRPIQAPYIFANLPLFSVVFCIWMFVLGFLAFSRTDPKVNWEHLVLAGLLGLVFIGFWVYIARPYGSYADDIYGTGHVRYVVTEGHIITGHPVLAYFDYPGMYLLVSAVSEITGLSIFTTRTLFMMLNAALFCALIYLVFAKWLGQSRLAFLAVLLSLVSGAVVIDKMRIFTPGALSLTLLAVLLIVEGLSSESLGSRLEQVIPLEILIFAAMTITYFATTFLVLLILLGTYLVQRLASRMKPSVAVSSLLLFSVLFLAWFTYGTWQTSHTIARFLPNVVDSLRSGEFLGSITTLAQANVGAALPLWANVIRLFWWGMLGVATIVGLRGLLHVKRLASIERLETGGLLGVLAMTIIGLVGTREGIQFARYLLYAPMFVVPMLLGFLAISGDWGRRAMVALIACVTGLILPTFLSSVNTVATDAIYSYDVSSVVFLESHGHDAGKDLTIFRASNTTACCAYYYLPDVSFRNIPESAYYGKEKDAFWRGVAQVTADFLNPNTSNQRQKVFILDEKTFAPAEHLLGVSREDEGWQTLNASLLSTNQLYDSGHVQMYAL